MSTYINKNSEQYFAFNIWNIESAKAVIDAASQLRKNLVLQTSAKAFRQGIYKSLQNGKLEEAGFDSLKVTKEDNCAICNMVKGKVVLLDRKESGEKVE